MVKFIGISSSFNSILSLDADYTISITTGDQSVDAPVTLKIRGDHGTVSIPLTKTKTNAKPFQAKANR